jgi:hypothetical protein
MPRRLRWLTLLLGVAAGCHGTGAPDTVAVTASAVTGPGQIAITPPVIPPTGTFEVTVTDADANVDPSSVDAVHVYVKSTRCSSLVRFSFLETGENTGEFRRTISTALAPCDPGNDTIEVDYGNAVTVDYRDPNATVGSGSCGSQIVSATAPVQSQFPDLRVDSVTVTPSVRYAGGPITVTASIRNVLGSPPVGRTSTARAIFGYWDSSDYPTIFEPLATIGDVEVQDLPSDGTQTVTFPAYTVGENRNGQFVIKVVADATSVVSEGNEGNNERLLEIMVLGPDLTVPPYSVTPAAPVAGGSIMLAGATVSPAIVDPPPGLPSGDPTAPASTTKAYLGQWDHSDYPSIWEPRYEIWTDPIGSLDAGQTDAFPQTSYAIPPYICGPYTVGVSADALNVVPERDEGNNLRLFDVNIVGPDLQVVSLQVTPSTQARGQSVTITGRVVNVHLSDRPDGTPEGAPVARASTTRVILGQMDYSDWPECFVELALVGTDAVPELQDGGADGDFSFTYTIPPTLAPGAYLISATADSGGVACERNEGNEVRGNLTVN